MIGIGLYLKNSLEAVALYREAFGLELGYHVMNTDGNGYFHSELNKNGEPQFCVVEAQEHPAGNPVQLGVSFDSREQLGKAFSLLKTGGTVKMEPPRAAVEPMVRGGRRPFWGGLVSLSAPAPPAGGFYSGRLPMTPEFRDKQEGEKQSLSFAGQTVYIMQRKIFYYFLEKITKCIFTFPVFCTRIEAKSYIQHLVGKAHGVCVQK